jgi:hypothetical protein
MIKPGLRQWQKPSDPGQGPYDALVYPNQVFGIAGKNAPGSGVVYYTDAAGAANADGGKDTNFTWPIEFRPTDYGPLTDQVPP